MKTFEDFKRDLASRESNDGNPQTDDYKTKNKFGYLGLYQFGKPRLYDFGLSVNGYHPKNKPMLRFISEEEFLNDRELQDKIFLNHTLQYEAIFKSKYSKFIGQKFFHKGIEFTLTLSGMVAVAHLLGPGGLRDFLNGKNNKDGLGTEASEYAMKFSNYDLGITN